MMRRAMAQVIGIFLITLMIMGVGGSSPAAQQLSIFPNIYLGSVTVSGEPAPDGLEIVARIGDQVSSPRPITDGKYVALTVNVPNRTYVGETITFHIGEIQADQTSVFRSATMLGASNSLIETLDLTFESLPIEVAFDPAVNATPPIIGDSSVPRIPPVAVAMGLSLLVMGIATLRLLHQGEERNSR
jgi:hypothetical protein